LVGDVDPTDFPLAVAVNTLSRVNWSLTVLSAKTWKLSTPFATLVPGMPQKLSANVSLKLSCEWKTIFAATPLPGMTTATIAATTTQSSANLPINLSPHSKAAKAEN
jgi:hypothetical protein